MKKIVIVAGDKSGDLYGGLLSKTLKERFTSVEVYSFGGNVLAQHSNQVINLLKHSVCGLIEILASLKNLINTFNKTLKEIRSLEPDLVILIDFPDFNLRLAEKLNNKYPVFYYVSPQVWAWRKKRVETIRKYVKEMIVIFEFEKKFYEKEGVEALYFGHPLLEIIKPQPVQAKKIISFLPGSRKNEVKKHLAVMQKAKIILEKKLPIHSFQIIRPANLKKEFYQSLGTKIKLVDHSYSAIQSSEFIITSSGTATVELAILGVPYLIIYKVNDLTWKILKRIVDAKFIGMVNILAKRKMVDELLQTQANPKNIAEITLTYLKDKQKYQTLKQNLASVKQLLQPNDSLTQLAGYIGHYLQL